MEKRLPRVGEGWVSETVLFYELKDALKGRDVIHHAHLEWLGRQHLDIFMPALRVAVEFQGLQHDEPVEYFGGAGAYHECLVRDERKRKLCEKNGIRLIYVRPGYDLGELIERILLT